LSADCTFPPRRATAERRRRREGIGESDALELVQQWALIYSTAHVAQSATVLLSPAHSISTMRSASRFLLLAIVLAALACISQGQTLPISAGGKVH
jgi:hypothetical protein